MRRLSSLILCLLLLSCHMTTNADPLGALRYRIQTKVDSVEWRAWNPWSPINDPRQLSGLVWARTRYFGDSVDRWQGPRETFLTRLGDCEDAASLLHVALWYEGVDSMIALVDSDLDGGLDHAVVLAKWRDEWIWLDPTDFGGIGKPHKIVALVAYGVVQMMEK